MTPGIGSHSPCFQSRTTPCGLAIASGVSCSSGTATTSVRTPRCVGGQLAELRRDRLPGVPVGAGLPRRRDRRVERVDERVHVGGVEVVLLVPRRRRQHDVGEDRRAGLPEVDRASAGRASPRAPRRATSTSRGRWPSGVSSARSDESVPSRCLRKYSLPLPEEPSRLARQIDEDPREVLRGVRVLAGEPQVAGLELVDDVLGHRLARPRRPRRRGRAGCGRRSGTTASSPSGRSGRSRRRCSSRPAVRCRSSRTACRRRTGRSGTGRCAGTSTPSGSCCRGGRFQSSAERELGPAGDRPAPSPARRSAPSRRR